MKKLLTMAAALFVLTIPVQAKPGNYFGGINWDIFTKMTESECVAYIDATLAKHGQELGPYEMSEACDHLTKGWPTGIINTMPIARQGTAERESMDECLRQKFAHIPRSMRPSKQTMELVCQR